MRLLVLVAVLVLELGLFFARDRGRSELDRLGGWRGAIPVRGSVALGLGQQRGQRARERVDLVGGQDRSVGKVRFVLGQQALEPEQQRELAPPLDRGLVGAVVELGQGSVERRPAGAAGSKGVFERFAVVDEALTREQFRARDRGRTRKRGDGTHVHSKVASGCASRGGASSGSECPAGAGPAKRPL